MKIELLKPNQSIFGNKGNVWGNTCHIYESGIGNLCGTPALSTNWARIEEVKEIGCPECLKAFESQQLNNSNIENTDIPDELKVHLDFLKDLEENPPHYGYSKMYEHGWKVGYKKYHALLLLHQELLVALIHAAEKFEEMGMGENTDTLFYKRAITNATIKP